MNALLKLDLNLDDFISIEANVMKQLGMAVLPDFGSITD